MHVYQSEHFNLSCVLTLFLFVVEAVNGEEQSEQKDEEAR
jgi:hypothetical protein